MVGKAVRKEAGWGVWLMGLAAGRSQKGDIDWGVGHTGATGRRLTREQPVEVG